MNMKKLGLIISAMSLSASAFANYPVAINNVSLVTKGICTPGEACPAVEPWREITFTYASCAVQKLELKVEEKNEYLAAQVVLSPEAYDCFGPRISRNYSLQIPLQYTWKPVQITNYLNDLTTPY